VRAPSAIKGAERERDVSLFLDGSNSGSFWGKEERRRARTFEKKHLLILCREGRAERQTRILGDLAGKGTYVIKKDPWRCEALPWRREVERIPLGKSF